MGACDGNQNLEREQLGIGALQLSEVRPYAGRSRMDSTDWAATEAPRGELRRDIEKDDKLEAGGGSG